ncbi:MAG: transketolase [Candidatus Neomarinimicrobiota bacterium]
MRNYLEIDSFSEWSKEEKDYFTIAVLKGLIMDGVAMANSGHPGGAFSSADFAYILFSDFLKFNPNDPDWFPRDRFVLSAGHESMLLYSLLSMLGWLTIEDLKKFRQLKSLTPGHPEVDLPGVEATTGPLGQGFAMGTGMAVAESMLRFQLARHSEKADELLGHFTYVLAGDGDMQEPITMGASALAGHWGISRLIVFYDANDAQISGPAARSDSSNYAQIFEGFNWHVQEIDGHDHTQIRAAIEKAQVVDRPSIIIGKTVMAYGTANMEGWFETHGAPLPPEEIKATKVKLGLPEEDFYFPAEAVEYFKHRCDSLNSLVSTWSDLLKTEKNSLQVKKFWQQCLNAEIPALELPDFKSESKMATRKAFGLTLDIFARQLPNLVGGSADLEPSNYTGNFADSWGDFQKGNRLGRNFAFGVREFPMAGILNGLALHGGLLPFGGTFLVFSDYERPALRLAAIQKLKVIHEFTHDSFYVGEDGPTHQPVEQIMSLRCIPDLQVFRPADANETAAAFEIALRSESVPSTLLLTRQNVPLLDLPPDKIKSGVKKGAYIVKTCDGPPDIIFLATGSEVSLALNVASRMDDKRIRVISMPCWEIFEQQSKLYRDNLIFNNEAIRISLEAGITQGWSQYINSKGLSIGINQYGASAPAQKLEKYFGFTAEQIEKRIRKHFENILQPGDKK